MAEPCQMSHTEPYDFASCATHDTTFPLGGACRFHGRETWEVYAEEADEQRQRAVRVEHQVAQVIARLIHPDPDLLDRVWTAIDACYDDDTPAYDADGRCVDSAPARAVMALVAAELPGFTAPADREDPS